MSAAPNTRLISGTESAAAGLMWYQHRPAVARLPGFHRSRNRLSSGKSWTRVAIGQVGSNAQLHREVQMKVPVILNGEGPVLGCGRSDRVAVLMLASIVPCTTPCVEDTLTVPDPGMYAQLL